MGVSRKGGAILRIYSEQARKKIGYLWGNFWCIWEVLNRRESIGGREERPPTPPYI